MNQKHYSSTKTKPRLNNNKPIVEGQIVAMNEFGDGEIHGHRRVIKVARTVVGDQVRVKVPDTDKRYVYGSLIKVLKPSEKRVDPNCEAFANGCGGCQWLHFEYAEQLRWKTRILREILKERCPTPIRVNEIIPMDTPFAYRNKLSLKNAHGHFVNMQEFDDAVIAAEHCRVETHANQAVRKIVMHLAVPSELLQTHIRSSEDGSVGVNLFAVKVTQKIREFAQKLSEEIQHLVGVGVQVKDRYELIFGRNFIPYTHSGLTYNIPLNGFFQTNYVQARYLCTLAVGHLAANTTDAVLDLYCGCGFFTLPIARTAKIVLGIENNAASTANATTNAKLNNLSNVKFQTADVAVALRGLKTGEWQKVLLDPPRAGCDEAVIKELIRLLPQRIVYVSCSPASLVRDLKQLQAASYAVSSCQPIDMFPHTAHMETVVVLNHK